jgi:hypothetical protein
MEKPVKIAKRHVCNSDILFGEIALGERQTRKGSLTLDSDQTDTSQVKL